MAGRRVLTPRAIGLGLLVVCIIAGGVGGYYALRPARAVSAINVDSNDVAIRGYDPVAYFTDGKAIKGSTNFEYVWQGAHWRFASDAHRDLFRADPERYAPRYGGYCSMGLAMGEYSDTDPEAWTIVNGKLYLNKAKWVRDIWRKGAKAYIVTSEINWKKNRGKLRVSDDLRCWSRPVAGISRDPLSADRRSARRRPWDRGTGAHT